MSGFKEKIRQIQNFLDKGIWEVESSGLSRTRGFLLRQGQLVLLVYREFMADGCLLRASALTYATLLAIVPLFALAFAVLSGLGVQKTLQPMLLEQITIGSQEIVNQILTYIENTNFTRLGAVGMVTLILTVLMLISNVEISFNQIWGVKETRSLFRRFADYTSVLLLGPVFLFVAISMTSTLESQSLVQALMEQAVVGEVVLFLFRVLPYVAMWAAFIFLYVFMPNIKVRLSAALIGGIAGGTMWQLAQWGYVNFQVGVARYNAIYGTMAALPILMAWIYLSWAIVLLGAEIAYAWQNLTTIRREMREQKVNYLSQEMVALTVMASVAGRFERGEDPWGMEKIAECLALPPRLGRVVIDELVAMRYLSAVRAGESEDLLYQPAKPPGQVRVDEFIQSFRGSGAQVGDQERVPEWESVREIEGRITRAEAEVLKGMTLSDLATRRSAEKVAAPIGASR